MYKDRNESPEEDISLKGICELNLSYNRLDSLFIKDLGYLLSNDRWLKSLNLRGNNIDENGISMVSKILDRNSSILTLDVRDNPGINS